MTANVKTNRPTG